MSKDKILKEFDKIDSYDLDMESQGSETVRKIFKDFLSKAIDKTREETIREVEERESLKLVHEKEFDCPTLNIQCSHDFKFSHTEEENKLGSNGTTSGTMPPRLFDVVVCSKCGEIRKSLKYLTN